MHCPDSNGQTSLARCCHGPRGSNRTSAGLYALVARCRHRLLLVFRTDRKDNKRLRLSAGLIPGWECSLSKETAFRAEPTRGQART
jgi:hypothetical protein